ncbi:siderophore ABC transporter substrate-binding protein [Dysgonomonas sp. Marseille-P4677]|uniref:siderophore ABC transporter substrate-binding protein n=1 Tax=Dysgonomonas sp. Marseille-P4677 TaxID=2364790 RepID=UPI001911E576|nr:siderophore ABC transporter substrate-binding protein [Dysgonomonas sp. Marseille-P4677]MBK5720803.1 siderophore ABC transporter substrate-binding protein [Dysgonomonas sp. Marseille-P4677]
MKTTFYILAVCALTGLFSCNSGQRKSQSETEGSENDKVSIIHQFGTTEVPKNPKRIVVLDFGALENLTALNIKPVAIPKTGLPQYLSQYKSDPSIVDVGNLVEVNLERINEAKPDLIIIGGRLASSYQQISQIAPTICLSTDYKDFLESFEKNITDLSKIFDTADKLNEALVSLKNRIEVVKSKTSLSDSKALVLIHNKGKFSAYGSGSRFGIIHDIFGIKEAKSGLDIHPHGNPVSSEFIQQVNPDILFIVDRSAVVNNEALDKKQIENKLVQKTNAFKNNKIIYLNSEAWYLSGGGGITSLNIMIDEIHKSI